MKRRLFWLILLCFAVLLAWSLMVVGEEKPPREPSSALSYTMGALCAQLPRREDQAPVNPGASAEPVSYQAPAEAPKLMLEDPYAQSKLGHERLRFQAFHYSDEAG